MKIFSPKAFLLTLILLFAFLALPKTTYAYSCKAQCDCGVDGIKEEEKRFCEIDPYNDTCSGPGPAAYLCPNGNHVACGNWTPTAGHTPTSDCPAPAPTNTPAPTSTPVPSSTPAPTVTGAPTLTTTPRPTPTTTVAPSPTSQPIPACTQAANITLPGSPATSPTLQFRLKLQGVETTNIGREADKLQKVRLSVYKQEKAPTGNEITTTLIKEFKDVEIKMIENTTNSIAIWKGVLTLSGVNPGSKYVVLIKGPKHLQKKFCVNNPTENIEGGLPYRCLGGDGQITIQAGENLLDFSGVLLQGGDLPTQDGIVNAYDVSLVINIIENGVSTDAEDLRVADIDLNGVVNAKDRSYLIETLEEKYGDEE